MEQLTSSDTFVWNTGSTSSTNGITISGSTYVCPQATMGYIECKESRNMKLYKVFLVRIDNRAIVEVNVAARSQADAIIKAFIQEQIVDVDDFDKYAQFICDLTEDDE